MEITDIIGYGIGILISAFLIAGRKYILKQRKKHKEAS